METKHFICAVAIVFMLAAGRQLFEAAQPPVPVTATQTPAPAPVNLNATPTKSVVKTYVKFEDIEWRTAAGGNVALVSGVVDNQSAIEIRDVEIACTTHGPSGTMIGVHTRTVFQSVCSGCSIRVLDLNMGFIDSQATSLRCGVGDFAI